jgi:hypothetical protein
MALRKYRWHSLAVVLYLSQSSCHLPSAPNGVEPGASGSNPKDQAERTVVLRLLREDTERLKQRVRVPWGTAVSMPLHDSKFEGELTLRLGPPPVDSTAEGKRHPLWLHASVRVKGEIVMEPSLPLLEGATATIFLGEPAYAECRSTIIGVCPLTFGMSESNAVRKDEMVAIEVRLDSP